MSSSRPVLFLVSVEFGCVRADPDAPHVSVTDLGVTRGDGIFETISVCDGRAQALERQNHVEGFLNSKCARGAAHEHRLKLASLLQPAGEIESVRY